MSEYNMRVKHKKTGELRIVTAIKDHEYFYSCSTYDGEVLAGDSDQCDWLLIIEKYPK